MRVAFVVTDLGLGGAQAFVELAACGLTQRGLGVTVYAERGPHDRKKRLEECGVEVVTFTEPPSLEEYGRLFAAAGIELVHLTVWQRLDVLRGLKRVTGVPVALSYNHVPRVRSLRERLVHPRFMITSLKDLFRESRGIDAHIGDSAAAAEALRILFWPLWRDKIHALPNGIPLPPQTNEVVLRGEACFLQLGSLTERKNPLATLRAFAAVSAEFAGATLVFVGDGPERPRLEEFCREHHLSGVTFAGETADLAPFFAQANIVVLPSRSEGLPYSLLEAAGRGLPIIATAVDGIPEIVRDNDNGILVTPGDDAALRTAMRLLASDAETRLRFGRRGRALVAEKFEIGGFISSLIAIYEQTVGRTISGTK